MFARQFRLPFNKRLPHPVSVYSPSFILKYAKSNLEYNRYGFIVSKKIDKRAVARNEIKRRFRAVIEQLHPSLPQGYDLLFILKSDAKGKTYKELLVELGKTNLTRRLETV